MKVTQGEKRFRVQLVSIKVSAASERMPLIARMDENHNQRGIEEVQRKRVA